jgi:hypothetical protein
MERKKTSRIIKYTITDGGSHSTSLSLAWHHLLCTSLLGQQLRMRLDDNHGANKATDPSRSQQPVVIASHCPTWRYYQGRNNTRTR